MTIIIIIHIINIHKFWKNKREEKKSSQIFRQEGIARDFAPVIYAMLWTCFIALALVRPFQRPCLCLWLKLKRISDENENESGQDVRMKSIVIVVVVDNDVK